MQEARLRFKESIMDPNLEGEQGRHLGSDLGPRQPGRHDEFANIKMV